MADLSQSIGQRENDYQALLAAYQGLTARYGSNFNTQWQIFALGLAAQGFVVGASSQVVGRVFTSTLLAVLILIIGFATVVSSLRIGLFASVDRHMLDEYEKLILGNHAHLRLRHGVPLIEREAGLPEDVRELLKNPRGVRGLVPMRLVRAFGPTIWWASLEVVISIIGALVPVLGIFGI